MQSSYRATFCETHRSVADADFIAGLGPLDPLLVPHVLVLRNVIAKLCSISTDLIGPGLTPEVLDHLMDTRPKGWDDLKVVLQLEEDLGIDLTGFELPQFEGRLFGLRVQPGIAS